MKGAEGVSASASKIQSAYDDKTETKTNPAEDEEIVPPPPSSSSSSSSLSSSEEESVFTAPQGPLPGSTETPLLRTLGKDKGEKDKMKNDQNLSIAVKN